MLSSRGQLKGSSEAFIDFDAESSVDSADLDRYAYSLSEDGSGERLEDGEFRLMVGIVFAEPLDVDFSLNLIAGVFGDSSPNAPGL